MSDVSFQQWFAELPRCERCGIKPTGSHYHCGGCDSTDTTSMYGHHVGMHVVDGKIVKTEFHHCTLHLIDGECELSQ